MPSPGGVRGEFYPVDLGNFVRGRWMQSGDLLISHDAPDGHDCGVLVRVSGPNAPYALISADPVTIKPRVVCKACKTSAEVTDGVWSPF